MLWILLRCGLVTIEHENCASHYLVWESQHMALLNASVEWLQQGTFQGQFNGSFAVDTAGQVHQEP
jgi:hypothetical protein